MGSLASRGRWEDMVENGEMQNMQSLRLLLPYSPSGYSKAKFFFYFFAPFIFLFNFFLKKFWDCFSVMKN